MKILLISIFISINISIKLSTDANSKSTRKLGKVSELSFPDLMAIVQSTFKEKNFKNSYTFEEVDDKK